MEPKGYQKISQEEYHFAERRIEALLPLVREETPHNAPERTESRLMTDVVALYEDEHYPIPSPTAGELADDASLGIPSSS